MDTPARLLRLLTLLSARPWWSGADLADRLEVTARTLRRDMARVRSLGYPVQATSGRYGGYRLGAAGHLPPLLLEDDEAVAAAIALRAASSGGAAGLETAALSGLTKLDQVLPVRLRERVDALRTVTVSLRPAELPAIDLDVLVTIAVACRRPERLRFSYQSATGETTERYVEPFRLVYTERRWYLVAFDLNRDDWRTFRPDRITDAKPTGVPFERADLPDAAALVAHGLAVGAHPITAVVRLHMSRARAERVVVPTAGQIESDDGDTTLVRVGGDAMWIAEYVIGLPCRVEVLEPDEVRAEVRALAERLLRDHG
jgi:predicted DNA-binding transcriptional regulator YafY